MVLKIGKKGHYLAKHFDMTDGPAVSEIANSITFFSIISTFRQGLLTAIKETIFNDH
jgi:hypothetical protein